MEGIAVATDTTTSTTAQFGGEEGVKTVFHTYYRRKLVLSSEWAIVQTGIAFINGKTVTALLESLPLDTESLEIVIETTTTTIKEELLKDSELMTYLPKGLGNAPFLTLGIVGYSKGRPVTHSLYFRLEEDGSTINVQSKDYVEEHPYGITYYGDYRFVQLVIKAAIDANLLKPFEVLTLREALDLARVLLKFLIDFQKFMMMSTVDYPIESAVITPRGEVQPVDIMKIEPLPPKHSFGSSNTTYPG